MEAGKLRHRMAIQSRAGTRGSSGGTVDTWATDFKLSCSLEQLSGRALEAAQATHPESTHEMRTRYKAGITANQRGLFRGKYYDFLNVNDVKELHRELRVLCKEGVSEG